MRMEYNHLDLPPVDDGRTSASAQHRPPNDHREVPLEAEEYICKTKGCGVEAGIRTGMFLSLYQNVDKLFQGTTN